MYVCSMQMENTAFDVLCKICGHSCTNLIFLFQQPGMLLQFTVICIPSFLAVAFVHAFIPRV